ncbi:TPA: hypothetical protein QHC28_002279 [Aeromonas veronii bv. veronii]|nr:hypothetical protein [Aeromonas veronii bv. veronii]
MSAICTISKNTIVKLHPAARSAYEWSQIYPRLISTHLLPAELKNILGRTVLRCVIQPKNEAQRSKTREVLFYAPVWVATYWQAGQPPVGSRVIYETGSTVPTDEQIEIEAWRSALLPLFLSVQSTQIALLRDSLQSMMPHSVCQRLFDKSKISDADICRWTGLSRGALIKQRACRADSNCDESVDLVSQLSASVDD